MTLDKKLLDILACPECKGDLKLDRDEDGLICAPCGLKYPVRNGIPIMLPEEAEKIDD